MKYSDLILKFYYLLVDKPNQAIKFVGEGFDYIVFFDGDCICTVELESDGSAKWEEAGALHYTAWDDDSGSWMIEEEEDSPAKFQAQLANPVYVSFNFEAKQWSAL